MQEPSQSSTPRSELGMEAPSSPIHVFDNPAATPVARHSVGPYRPTAETDEVSTMQGDELCTYGTRSLSRFAAALLDRAACDSMAEARRASNRLSLSLDDLVVIDNPLTTSPCGGFPLLKVDETSSCSAINCQSAVIGEVALTGQGLRAAAMENVPLAERQRRRPRSADASVATNEVRTCS